MKAATGESPESCRDLYSPLAQARNRQSAGPVTWPGSAPVVPSLTFTEMKGNPTTRCGVRGRAWGFLQTAEARRGVVRLVRGRYYCSCCSNRARVRWSSVTTAGGIGDVRDEARKQVRIAVHLDERCVHVTVPTRPPRKNRRTDEALTSGVVGDIGGLLNT